MEKRKEILSELFNKYRNELKELNEYLYNNPELGLGSMYAPWALHLRDSRSTQ